MKLLVVVLNYRTAELAIDCLRSLEGEIAAVGDARVVVVDNASGDGSVERIAAVIEAEGWDGWCELRPQETNGGFAAGNNRAIAPALAGSDPPRFVHLLNSDTAVRPGALATLLEFLEARPRVGLAGSRLDGEDGEQQHSRYRFPTARGEFAQGTSLRVVHSLFERHVVAPPLTDEAHEIDWVAFASVMIRTEVFADVGLLDEGYFMYFEDTDFALQARRAGWTCWYVPASRVMHLVGRSSGVTVLGERPARRPRYWFDAHARYHRKNRGPWAERRTALVWLVAHGLAFVRRLVTARANTQPPWLWWDFLRYRLTWRGGATDSGPQGAPK
ncbi:MAG: glycosyltransferase family 2 protein [Planctomycetota bacterium]|nr:glycosyltransferase family 2 protein [Planctomycetota bacterium]MDP6990170.1 glycosyltransferase family 2 protein [Planctomycetota bacterium]